jgi:opacity protein-like surface antigen
MRNFVIALAAAGSALALASPAAAAQYYPQPQQPYGYGGQPYGYANDYGNPHFNSVHALQARIDALQSRIRWMDPPMSSAATPPAGCGRKRATSKSVCAGPRATD